jgi:hypothetical protein
MRRRHDTEPELTEKTGEKKRLGVEKRGGSCGGDKSE